MKKLSLNINSSITRKLIMSYLVIILVPLTIGSFIFTNYSYKALKQDLQNTVEYKLEQLNRSVSDRIDACIQISKLVKWDKSIIDFLQTSDFTDAYLVDKLNNEIVPKLQVMRFTGNRYIYKLILFQRNQKIHNVKDIIYYDKRIENMEWEKKLKALKPEASLWSDSSFIENIHEERLRTLVILGIVRINLKLSRPTHFDANQPLNTVNL